MYIPILYPYHMGSISAQTLAQALNAKRVFPDGTYHYNNSHLAINWGSTRQPNWETPATKWLNPPPNVLTAADKVQCFQALSAAGISVPIYDRGSDLSQDTLMRWLRDGDVYLRWNTRGHSGQGIQVIPRGTSQPPYDPFHPPPLVVRGLGRRKEFRAHILGGEVVRLQQKRHRRDWDGDYNYAVRNYDNGWIYSIHNLNDVTDEALNACIAAVSTLGLHFGAVDFAIHQKPRRTTANQPFALFEVNTAPGMDGTTIDAYTHYIQHTCTNGI